MLKVYDSGMSFNVLAHGKVKSYIIKRILPLPSLAAIG
jgi:hypothetical protein